MVGIQLIGFGENKMGKYTELVEKTLEEGLSPISKKEQSLIKNSRMENFKTCQMLLKRVKQLMGKNYGFSLDASIKQAVKDIKNVDKNKLKEYINLYDE